MIQIKLQACSSGLCYQDRANYVVKYATTAFISFSNDKFDDNHVVGDEEEKSF